MPRKLAKNKKIREAHREHAKKVLSAVEEPNIVTEIEVSKGFRAEIHAALVKLQRCQTSESESNEQHQGKPPVSTQAVNAKLPKLYIKKFTGDPKEWQSFWDSFSSAVHTDKALNYLRSLLEGAALSAITGHSLTEPNYTNAIDILNERFGNKQLIISSHMEALLKLKSATALSDIRGI